MIQNSSLQKFHALHSLPTLPLSCLAGPIPTSVFSKVFFPSPLSMAPVTFPGPLCPSYGGDSFQVFPLFLLLSASKVS